MNVDDGVRMMAEGSRNNATAPWLDFRKGRDSEYTGISFYPEFVDREVNATSANRATPFDPSDRTEQTNVHAMTVFGHQFHLDQPPSGRVWFDRCGSFVVGDFGVVGQNAVAGADFFDRLGEELGLLGLLRNYRRSANRISLGFAPHSSDSRSEAEKRNDER
jgi:hypothetical protein